MGRFASIALCCLIALLALAALPVQANLRCDSSLIARGQTILEVLERCGAPEFEMQFADYRYPGYLVQVHEWTFELGSNKFRRLLTFENGRLVRIEVLGKPKRSAAAALAGGGYR
jgi:hypothetical protein